MTAGASEEETIIYINYPALQKGEKYIVESKYNYLPFKKLPEWWKALLWANSEDKKIQTIKLKS